MGKYLRLVVVGDVICFGLLLPRNDTEKLAHLHQVLGPPGIGEQAVMSDTVEPQG